MKRVIWGTVLVVGCSGPVALDRAIRPQDRADLDSIEGRDGRSPKACWLARKARTDGITIDQARTADQTLSTTKNPFDARQHSSAISLGAMIFEAHCARCHGRDARGHGPDTLPDHPCRDFHAFDKRLAVTLHGGAPRTWFGKISEGHGPLVDYPSARSRAMPAFKDLLAREQIWLAVTYLQSLDVHARARAAGGPGTDQQ